ncbi:MAG: hypothetical protein ABW035_10530 [Acidimicrobiales bacterium]
MRRILLTVLAGLALVAVLPDAASADTVPRAERVFVFSVPTLSWAEANDFDLPHLSALLDESAIGGLSTRAVDRRTTPGDGYTTINAGTRADGDPDFDGLAFEVGEGYLGEPAEQIFTRRTGTPVDSGLFSLALPALDDVNDSLDFGAEVGALGDALGDGGAHAAVIATADGTNEESKTVFARQAVISLMDSEGLVPAGRVGDDLLEPDPEAPFGRRLDQQEVVAAFDSAWVDDAVVLVEASDLVRADSYRTLATRAQRTRQRRLALERTDELLGRLLERIDPATDAVMVVGPYPATDSDHLTLAALRAPGVEPGLLKSAVTRRSGFVTSVDVAPTILSLLDIPRPDSMEGRHWERSETGGTAVERREWLEQANAEAQWRDEMVALVATLFVVAQLVLWIVAVRALNQESGRGRQAVEVASLAVLAVLPLTYIAGAFPFHEWGAPAFWAYLIGGGALLGIAAQRLLRRWPADPLLGVLFLMLGVLCLDVLVGAPLQLNTVFGYTPTVAGRFAGLGNLAFAQLAASATILAGLLASRIGGRRGIAVALGLLGAVLVIDASPFWGSDVGGALTLVPTLAGVAFVLLGIRIRLRTAVLVGLGTVVVFLVAGFIDLARPEESRSHLGRLFEDIGNDGFGAFETVVFRKLAANFDVLASSEWTLMLPVVFAFILYLIWRAPGRLQRLQEVIPQERAARVGFVIAATLGFALNDSGIAVPGLMLGVMNASLVYLVLRTEDPPWKAEIDAPDAEPELVGST